MLNPKLKSTGAGRYNLTVGGMPTASSGLTSLQQWGRCGIAAD